MGISVQSDIPCSPSRTASAITTIALSAIGSSIAPKRLICAHFRASQPSM
jgi:hypothetical protein